MSDAALYDTHSIRSGGANDPGFRSLDSSLEDRHVGWKNDKSKYRYLAAGHDALIKITQAMNIQVISFHSNLVAWPGEP